MSEPENQPSSEHARHSREENPFEDETTAQLWVNSVEGEQGLSRDKYIYPLVRRWLSDPSIERVLDIGAGQGIGSTLAIGKRYVGVEPSEPLVRRAKQLYAGRGEFVVGNAYELPFGEGSFDAAFSINVWFHLKELQRASRELARVLKPGGQFLVVSANPAAYDIWRSFFKNFTETSDYFMGAVEVPPNITLPKNTIYKHSQDDIVRAFQDAGLQVEGTAPFAPYKETGRDHFAYYRGHKAP